MGMTSSARSIRLVLPTLTFLIAATTVFAGSDSIFSPGHDAALNAICGDRSGRSWSLNLLEPSGAGAMEETVVPAAGRTDIVRIMPSAIVPCVKVIVSTDAMGRTYYDLAVDAANVNRDFLISDIHTGEALQFCPVAPTAAALSPVAFSPGSAFSEGFNKGHVSALNTLCGNGRSGRSWAMDAPGSMTETVIPAVNRTDIVRIMPSAIIPCIKVKVATDESGRSRYELAVDALNVNRDFHISDIHSGEALQLCASPR